MALTVAIESALTEDVRALVAELNTALQALSPPEFCYHLTIDQMAEHDVTVWVARDHGEPVACGALKRHGSGIGEIKRMYTRPQWQGQCVASRILGEIVNTAINDGLDVLVLETGTRHPAAWAVYEKAGFSRCGPVLDYPDTEYSIFYHKQLAA